MRACLLGASRRARKLIAPDLQLAGLGQADGSAEISRRASQKLRPKVGGARAPPKHTHENAAAANRIDRASGRARLATWAGLARPPSPHLGATSWGPRPVAAGPRASGVASGAHKQRASLIRPPAVRFRPAARLTVGAPRRWPTGHRAPGRLAPRVSGKPID